MSDATPSLAQIRRMERLDIRWRILLMAHRGRGLGVNEMVILGGLRGMGYQLTQNEVRNEIEYLTGLPAGPLYAALNVPLFVIAWRHVDRTFAILSVVGMAAFSAALWATASLATLEAVSNPVVSALFGGAISGAGAGLALTDFEGAEVNQAYRLAFGQRAGDAFSDSKKCTIGSSLADVCGLGDLLHQISFVHLLLPRMDMRPLLDACF